MEIKLKSTVRTMMIVIALFVGIFIYVSIKEEHFLPAMIATGGLYWLIGIIAAVVIIGYFFMKYTGLGKKMDEMDNYAKEFRTNIKKTDKKELQTKLKAARKEFFLENKGLMIAQIFVIIAFVFILIYYFQIPRYDYVLKAFLKRGLYGIGIFQIYFGYKMTKHLAEKTRK